MPTCNFASAAPEEEYVYGACAPNWRLTPGRTIDDWLAFMNENDVRRVCCLLSERQVADYDNLIGEYQAAFGSGRVRHAPVSDHTLMSAGTLLEEVIPFIENAVDDSERVVVHCMAGVGRTGVALAGWLVYAHEYPPTDAITTVSNRHRRPDDAVRAGNATREELIGLLKQME